MKVKYRKSYHKEEEDPSFFITDIKVENGKKYENTHDNRRTSSEQVNAEKNSATTPVDLGDPAYESPS